MIDWVDFVAPLAHEMGTSSPFYAGEVMATNAAGELDWGIFKRMALEGSHSAKIQIRSAAMDDGRQAVRVSGNLVKWFQGHNIFGSDDLHGLVLEMLHRVCKMAGHVTSSRDVNAWQQGVYKLVRVDVTQSFDLGNLSRVRNALRSMDATANLKHRGRGHFAGDSITFGKGSRRWSLTLYAKGAEIEVKGHKLPLDLQATQLPALANGLLRVEVRLLALELVKESLQYGFTWGENTASELHSRFLAGLEIAETTMLESKVIEGLQGRQQLSYQAWKDGHDLRAMLPRNTFYRYRAELLKHGIDIAVKQVRVGPDFSNVVPIRTVLHAYPVSVPDWAVGTPLYFEPRAQVA